jgi:hypothetical protein
VGFDAVVAAEHAHDAALRPGGRAFGELALGDHHHGLILRQMQRDRESRQPGTDDDDWQSVGSTRCWSHGIVREVRCILSVPLGHTLNVPAAQPRENIHACPMSWRHEDTYTVSSGSHQGTRP